MLFLVVVALNTLTGIAQEVHAKRLVEKLSLLSLPTARVIRDGAPAEIPTQDLVEEDVIELETGRQVCADAVLLTGAAEVNESLLTGESDPVRRSAGEHLLSGSFVVSGRCRARVEHVGRENYAARIAQEAKALLDDLRPKVFLPMHYRMGAVGLPAVGQVEDFLSLVENYVYYPTDTLSLDEGTKPQIAVLHCSV